MSQRLRLCDKESDEAHGKRHRKLIKKDFV